MKFLELKHLSVKFQEVLFFNDVNLNFEVSKFHVILGNSGSGKTTILRVIAGFQPLDAGEIYHKGEPIQDLTPAKRKIGYVPQDYVLFPSLNVFDNISFGLSNINKTEIQLKVQEIARELDISDLLTREITNLSGGEKQRVALARALIIRPEILLLDEPLSAIDTGERLRLSLLIRSMARKYYTTTIYITHSVQEAELLADNIFLLQNGRVLNQGNFRHLRETVKTEAAARILGLLNTYDQKSFSPEFLASFTYNDYQRGDLLVIPPEDIIMDLEGSIQAEIIQETEKHWYIYLDNHPFVMLKNNTTPLSVFRIKISK